MSIAFLAGCFLLIAAVLIARGDIEKATVLYILSDAIWVSIAFTSGDYVGAGMITIGAIAGVYVYYRMQRGDFHKNLKKPTHPKHQESNATNT